MLTRETKFQRIIEMTKVYARETFDGTLVTNQIKGYPRHYLQMRAACKAIGAPFDLPRKSECVVEYELVPTGRKFNMKGELIE